MHSINPYHRQLSKIRALKGRGGVRFIRRFNEPLHYTTNPRDTIYK